MWLLPNFLTGLMRHVFAVTSAIMIAVVLASQAQARVDNGGHFPDLNRFSYDGAVPSYSGKVTLVDFWASWCVPCRASFPALSKIHLTYGDEVAIVGVSIDENESAYRQFLRRYQPAFPTVRDSSQQLVAAVEVPTMPTSYLLDRHGVVRFVHVGFHDNTPAEISREIDLLLKETP